MALERAFPPDPIAAVTHPDPYPFYAGLVAGRPLYRDEALGLWVAASAEAVTAVLASDLCRVRPPAEPVPRALVDTPAGEIFRSPRADDRRPGPRCACKPAVAANLASFGEARRPRPAANGRATWSRAAPAERSRGLADFQFRLPVYTSASLLGVPADELRPVPRGRAISSRRLAPASTAEQIERGSGRGLPAGAFLALSVRR